MNKKTKIILAMFVTLVIVVVIYNLFYFSKLDVLFNTKPTIKYHSEVSKTMCEDSLRDIFEWIDIAHKNPDFAQDISSYSAIQMDVDRAEGCYLSEKRIP